jgi:hypothetical protein
MYNKSQISFHQSLIPFDRTPSDSDDRMRCIGSGSIGGKAHGLVVLQEILSSHINESDFPQIDIYIPNLTVICTDVFDIFMERNDLYGIATSDSPDDRIAHAFQKADLPFDVLGDLRALMEQVHTPLAIRSSSLLEDATYEPFAGVYATKMIPNHQHDPGSRFGKLTEAIKLVYASTFFKSAKNYRKATHHSHEDEKMAVIIQNVVGKRYSLRFYPEISGVARSYNFYPFGRAKYEDGVVNLALGLGRTIVDGGISWTYSPAYPRVGPPFGSIGELLNQSQREFWAINMGTPVAYDPIRETEYLVHENLATAERDDTLRYLCSTYDPQSDRLNMGMGMPGPRALNFAPLLELREIPMNDFLKSFMAVCENEMNTPVEIEYAMTFNPHRLGLLQVRPMVVSSETVEVTNEDLIGENVLIASENILGNGLIDNIHDIVFVIPENFKKENTRKIASEIEKINNSLAASNRPYLLIVFGRLGSSDPWLGIPVNWGQISAARVIVEATQTGINVEMSQGSHFFHNMTSLGISYISAPLSGKYKLDWDWLEYQEEVQTTQFVRHVRLPIPLNIKVDGRTGRGVVYKS